MVSGLRSIWKSISLLSFLVWLWMVLLWIICWSLNIIWRVMLIWLSLNLKKGFLLLLRMRVLLSRLIIFIWFKRWWMSLWWRRLSWCRKAKSRDNSRLFFKFSNYFSLCAIKISFTIKKPFISCPFFCLFFNSGIL